MVSIECTWYKDEEGKDRPNEDIYNKIYGVMNKLIEEGNVFAGKRDRLDYAPYSYLIKYNDIDVGFIYITRESRYNYALFLDMAIIKEYRGKGIGTVALKQFLDEVKTNTFIIGETKNNNISSNPLGDDIGVKILDGEFNYYLFPKSRYEEFIEFNQDHNFEKAMSKDTKNSNELLHELYEESNDPKKLIKE